MGSSRGGANDRAGMNESAREVGLQGTVHPSGLEIVTVPGHRMEKNAHAKTRRKKWPENFFF